MKRVLFFLAGLALSTTACSRMSDEAKQMLRIDDDSSSVAVSDEGNVRIDSKTTPAGRGSKGSRPTVVAPGVRVDDHGVRVDHDGSKVRVNGDGDDVRVDTDDTKVHVNKDGAEVKTGHGKGSGNDRRDNGNTNVHVDDSKGGSIHVRTDEDGDHVEVGGIKIDDNGVNVPGVGNVGY